MHGPEIARRAREATLRCAYRVAYHLIGVYGRVRRPAGRGVKCVLVHDQSVVLVRHTYGPRHVWHIPGGGLHRGESVLAAAQREMQEELGVEDVAYHGLGQLQLWLQHRRVSIECVHAELPDAALRADPVEIAEAALFARDALPPTSGPEVGVLVARAFDLVAVRERTGVGE